MNNQKLENLLNLALDADENERELSEILDVGYDPIEKEWELIVKYHGSLDGLREQKILVEELIAGYAILTVPETLVDLDDEETPKSNIDAEDGSNTLPMVGGAAIGILSVAALAALFVYLKKRSR